MKETPCENNKILVVLEENEPANYTDKHEIVRILKAAVENGAKENMAEQHADEVQDMLGQDRVFD